MVGVFGGIAGEFISWAGKQVLSLLEIIFAVVAPGVMPYIAKAQAAFQTIIKDPVGFVGNLVGPGRLGFQKFADNFLDAPQDRADQLAHRLAGRGRGLHPEGVQPVEIVKFVLSVLGLTWQNIRAKLVKTIGEPVCRRWRRRLRSSSRS